MYHTAFRGMDAIDYEPDADFIDALCGNGYSSDEFEESDEYPTDEDEESLATDPDDLRNPKSFPAYKSCAPRSLYQSEDWLDSPPRHWCFLGQITKTTTYRGARAAINVEDKDEESILVTFHFDSTVSFDYESLKVNHTIAVLYAEQYDYPDGRIFPCPLLALLIINVNIEQETPVDSSQCCTFCQREDDPVKMSLLRCSRCLAASYCGKDCQLIDWKSSHKDECKIYKSVLELKQSRRWGDAFPRKWIAFGEKEEQEEQQSGCIYRFDSAWRSVEPAGVQKLQGCFTITSGELIWGQLASFLDGMMTTDRDRLISTDEPYDMLPCHFRAAAKNGVWKLAKVNGRGDPDADKDSWIAYHSSYDSPLELLLLTRSFDPYDERGHPRVRRMDCDVYEPEYANEMRIARFFSDIDPTSGWAVAVERRKRLHAANKLAELGHPDYEKWERLPYFGSDNAFLVDAARASEVAKLLARSSMLDTHLASEISSSFFSGDAPTESFGCHLQGFGEEWDAPWLIYGEKDSTMFPGEKELVAFWYDRDSSYSDCDSDGGHDVQPPLFEIL